MSERWYKDGLKFKCTQCGNCCGGSPGEVHVNDAEIEQLAKRFEVSEVEFKAMFTEKALDGGLTLRDRRNYECVFYDRNKGCVVYEDRPTQCRTWPFWRVLVHSPRHWTEAAKNCPGLNTGPTHSLEKIEESIKADGTSGYLPKDFY